MIITVTGKPCSGKGAVCEEFVKKYNFEYMSTGEIFRFYSKKFNFNSILDFQANEKVKEIDSLVDNKTIKIGKTRLNDDIIFDSRLAWHFIPKSFKVFIDVDLKIAGERLITADRENEKANNLEQAMSILKARWDVENKRYRELYKVDNTNINQYDLVISSNNKTPKQIASIIYKEYTKFMQKA